VDGQAGRGAAAEKHVYFFGGGRAEGNAGMREVLGGKGSGLALVGGETAEMPGVYVEGELDLAGTIVGVVERDKLIHGRRIEPGDVVIAVPSSGLHTNGYSLARRALAGLDLLEAREELGGASLADALLAIHKPYLNEFRALREAAVDIRGMVHVTGGGLIDNPPRVLTSHTAFRFYDETIVLPDPAVDRKQTTDLDWTKLLGGKKAGIILLEIQGQPLPGVEGKTPAAQALVQLTDLGILWQKAGPSVRAHVFSTASAKAVPSAGAQMLDADLETIAREHAAGRSRH
jgi:hypothetical protein